MKMPTKLKMGIFIVMVIGFSFIACQLWLMHIPHGRELRYEDIKVPVILWWTPFVSSIGRLETCGSAKCWFTQDRTFWSHNHLEAILFYGSSVQIDDLPIPRQNSIDWGLIHEESPRNAPIFTSGYSLALFNHSATFSRYSDVPLTLVDLDSEEELIGTSYFMSFEEKDRLIRESNLAPLLYIQSDCDTASERDSYVEELMKYISIDSYGTCLNNKRLPKRLTVDHLESLKDREFLSLTAQYKFTIAFENAVCNDYITEKLWRPLIVGSVPVYYGSPSFKDWLPNEGSAISIADFADPKELANYLLALADDVSRYKKFIAHKLSADPTKRITNIRLLNTLRNRSKNVMNEFGTYVQTFECLVCQRVHAKTRKRHTYIVTQKHYNCPMPLSPLTHRINKNNGWVHEWDVGRCKAKLLAEQVWKRTRIDLREFDKNLSKFNPEHDC